jgi:hypothetical protein
LKLHRFRRTDAQTRIARAGCRHSTWRR